jgi:Fe-S-cluster containining protein
MEKRLKELSSRGFMFYTRVLKSIFASYKTSLTAEDYSDFEIHVSTLITNYINEFSKITPGVERGRYIHQLIETEILKTSHIATTCSKGCGACCHLEVEITNDDAAVLSQVVLDGASIDFTRLQSLSERPLHDQQWSKGPVTENRCLFLGVGDACTVYESRPSTCRKVAVTSHPRECSDPNGNLVPVTIPMAEIILSAALNLPDNNIGSLPKQLLKTLEKNKMFDRLRLVNQLLINPEEKLSSGIKGR